MIRKLLKTDNNKIQIKFILDCSHSSWKLRNKIVGAKFFPIVESKSEKIVAILNVNRETY